MLERQIESSIIKYFSRRFINKSYHSSISSLDDDDEFYGNICIICWIIAVILCKCVVAYSNTKTIIANEIKNTIKMTVVKSFKWSLNKNSIFRYFVLKTSIRPLFWWKLQRIPAHGETFCVFRATRGKRWLSFKTIHKARIAYHCRWSRLWNFLDRYEEMFQV